MIRDDERLALLPVMPRYVMEEHFADVMPDKRWHQLMPLDMLQQLYFCSKHSIEGGSPLFSHWFTVLLETQFLMMDTVIDDFNVTDREGLFLDEDREQMDGVYWIGAGLVEQVQRVNAIRGFNEQKWAAYQNAFFRQHQTTSKMRQVIELYSLVETVDDLEGMRKLSGKSDRSPDVLTVLLDGPLGDMEPVELFQYIRNKVPVEWVLAMAEMENQ